MLQGPTFLEGSSWTPTSRYDHKPQGVRVSLTLVWPVTWGSSSLAAKVLSPQRSGVGPARTGQRSCRPRLPPAGPARHQLVTSRQSRGSLAHKHRPLLGGGAAPKRPCRLGRRPRSGLLEDLKSRLENRKARICRSDTCAGEGMRAGNPRAPGLLTSLSPSLSLSLSLCPAAGLSGLPSGVTLTLWSGKVEDPFLRATQEVC